jgi:RNA polymerase sigma factor (sigma-70 family)
VRSSREGSATQPDFRGSPNPEVDLPAAPPAPDVITITSRADVHACAWDSRSDEQLVALTRRGHRRAFDALAARYEPRLLWLCRRMLKSTEDAEDALQEVFVSAFKAIISGDCEIRVRPWLYRIATNRCINHLRGATTLGIDTIDDCHAMSERTVFDDLISRHEFRQLVCDLQALPERQRAAVISREIDGMSYGRIALEMDTTIAGVKSLLVRARTGLRAAAASRSPSPHQAGDFEPTLSTAPARRSATLRPLSALAVTTASAQSRARPAPDRNRPLSPPSTGRPLRRRPARTRELAATASA